jgi:hypothetical protein
MMSKVVDRDKGMLQRQLFLYLTLLMENHTHDEKDFELIVLYMPDDGTDSYSTFIS